MNDFSKDKRLLTKKDFQYVFDNANKVTNNYFIFLYRKNNLEHSRLGMALSKKRIAKAHARNRIKRLLRETFRVRKTLPAIDIVVLAKPGLSKVSSSVLMIKIIELWDQLTCI